MASTPRRSTRGQVFTPMSPHPSAPPAGTDPANTSYTWLSASKNSAGTAASSSSSSSTNAKDKGKSTDTRVYYSSFSRIRRYGASSSAGPPGTPSSAAAGLFVDPDSVPGTPRKKKTKPDEEARFAVGDGVVVAVEGGNEGIGMLTAMWDEPIEKEDDDEGSDEEGEEEEEEGEEGDGEPKLRKMAQVHWFLRKQDLPSVMRDLKLDLVSTYGPTYTTDTSTNAPLPQNEVLLAASPNRPVTTDLPVELLVRTIPIYSKALFRQHFPEEARQTKWKGWAVPLENVYWCARAYDRSGRGGRVWKVDVDEWKGRGRAGEGWMIPAAQVGDSAADSSSDDDDDDSDSDAEVDGDEDDDESSGEDEAEEEEARPTKKRRAPTTSTPRKRARATTSKAKAKAAAPAKRKRVAPGDQLTARRRRALAVAASASRLPSMVPIEDLPADPYERALRLLHVGATPESLPCREEEFVDVLARVEEGVESGGGGCLCECR